MEFAAAKPLPSRKGNDHADKAHIPGDYGRQFHADRVASVGCAGAADGLIDHVACVDSEAGQVRSGGVTLF
jgi:hypothetical protein